MNNVSHHLEPQVPYEGGVKPAMETYSNRKREKRRWSDDHNKRIVGGDKGPKTDRAFRAMTEGPGFANQLGTTGTLSQTTAPDSCSSDSSTAVLSSPAWSHAPGKNKKPRDPGRSGKGPIAKPWRRYAVNAFQKSSYKELALRKLLRKNAILELLSCGTIETFRRPQECTREGELKRGDIISVVVHYRWQGADVDLEDDGVSYAGIHGAAHSKFRKLVVMEAYAEHYNCAPILTYRNTGGNGRGDLLQELVHIRDADKCDNEELEILGENVILARRGAWYQGEFIRAPAVVKVSERETIKYSEKCCVGGTISPEAFVFLSTRTVQAFASGSIIP